MGNEKKSVTALRCLGQVLCLMGCCWFLLPLFRGGFRLGACFGFGVCLLGFLLLSFFGRLSRQGGKRQAAARLLLSFYLLGLAWAGYLTGLMLSARVQTPPEGVPVIILGSQVYGPRRMGVALTNRVDRAFVYLEEHAQAVCICTGGQGEDEPCPESWTERNVLLDRGIAAERIFWEDRSENTRQNLVYAKEVVDREDLGQEFALVTQGFHMYRALQLGKSAGFVPYSLPAQTDPLLLPEYYGRELLSLTKWQVERLFLG